MVLTTSETAAFWNKVVDNFTASTAKSRLSELKVSMHAWWPVLFLTVRHTSW